MKNSKRRAITQSWSTLQDDFAMVLARFHGEQVDQTLLEKAHVRIQQQVHVTAIRLLRHWHVRNAELEAADVVQQWNVEMYSAAYCRCSRSQSIVAFALKILRRGCSAVVRRESRDRLRFQASNPADERLSWLELLEHTELLELLHRATATLPSKLRKTVELWLYHRATNTRLTFVTQRECQQFHSRMFRARRRLKIVLGQLELGE